MAARNAIRSTFVAATAVAALLLYAPAALANHTNDVVLGAVCPDGSANHPCNGGTGKAECRLKSDTGKFVCTDTTAAPSGAVTTSPKPCAECSAGPNLSIPIPTLKFTDIIQTRAGDTVTLSIPWLAQYIQAVYRYALGIASIIAAIMMMVGGFRWMTAGGDAGRVSQAKDNIKDAIIGLGLALGGFALLTVVNADLAFLKGIDITMVQKITYETEDLQTTTADTSEPGASGAVAGTHTNPYTACPLNLTAAIVSNDNPSTNARAHEFFNQIGSIATASAVGERVVQISDAAAVCKVYMGSCGRTAGTIYTLAGLGANRDCLSGGKDGKGCWTHEKARQVKTYSQKQIGTLHHFLCKNKCDGKSPAANPKMPDMPDCKATRNEALTALREHFTQEIGGGYPDAWAQLLQPGDTLWIYNGYAPCTGLHSVVFMGWAQGGKAQIVQGTAGYNANASTVCLTSACGAAQQPIVKIFRP